MGKAQKLLARLRGLLGGKTAPQPPESQMKNPYRPIYGKSRRVEDIARRRAGDGK